jgi:drug/metabolite transporter (DMT)-like permease
MSTIALCVGLLIIALFSSTYNVTRKEIAIAVTMPKVWIIAVLTAIGYLTYLVMLKSLNVHRVALMVPLVLIGTLFSSAVFMGERFSTPQCVGVAIMLLGLVAFYWNDISSLA